MNSNHVASQNHMTSPRRTTRNASFFGIVPRRGCGRGRGRGRERGRERERRRGNIFGNLVFPNQYGITIRLSMVCIMVGLLFGHVAANATEEPWCFYDDPALYYARMAKGIDDEKRICEKEWPNPQTLPEELALPMPCGRRMLFRRIDLELSQILGHRRIYMGRKAQAMDALRSGSGETVVAGAFSCTGRSQCALSDADKTATDGLKPRRIYYMGKYEVSAPQYALRTIGAFDARNGEGCKELDTIIEDNGEQAATGMSWFDAAEFTRLYTEWLLQKAPEALPMEGRTRGFLRLPTEAEWEYAARAHWAIDPARQSEEGYPLSGNDTDNDSDDDHSGNKKLAALWSRSSTRPPRPGTGPANTFGLWDLAGGVAEMTMDLYRYRWLDGLPHGQSGGFIARGLISSQKAKRADVHDRAEIPFYSANGATRQKTLGFRLMITAPVEVDGLNLETMRARISEITAPIDSDSGAAEKGLEDLIRAVQSGKVQGDELERGLENIKIRLTQSSVKLREKEIESLRRRLVGLVLLAVNIDRQGRHAMAILADYHATRTRYLKNEKLSETDKEKILKKLEPTFKRYLDLIQGQEKELDIAFRFYLSEISDLVRGDITGKDFTAALEEARVRLDKTRLARTGTFFIILKDHIQQAHRTRGVISGKWRTDWLYRLDTKRVRRDQVLDRKREPMAHD
uniref:Formylglycine-generating enzyme, required for sulfatase activity, contains SUMF1/FGE domain n=1 Tax=Candidatus Kentrum sp. MB TaxID=2138164 RepID=A0A451BB73_9GAMM|nr:MAG: Formylglycine-generating enzyme, required for sulfatase activity, contains SUMF1/FGE domain [Candidatus Kentron sp. MB]VFK31067.1 MAG: Formylglycine-generating enzyme, required for sulfatase activity, contains SUMF1/FGE domain [Candidatus Kentron sp. MB]VFK75505.1 MAG: Formylglycine-generating enzyme, required for sulfatase activity, contains SUMF1/FGE domain [Candidatus Kentron sp. MB]